MNREYHKWYSSQLGRDMEFLLYGHAGRPILVFPTSMGRFYQNEDFHMIGTLGWRLDNGEIQVLCVDGIDLESWYNRYISPHDRAQRHNAYERYIMHELLPWWQYRNWAVGNNLCVTGASFGAYHAANFAFRHPDLVRKMVAMSGSFSLSHLVYGDWSGDVFLNSPADYLPDLHDDWFLSRMRQMEIILAAGDRDICLDATRHLSTELWAKAVPHWLDIWSDAWHDWPIWREMAIKFLY
jgi:esterase/lipase superfamily enzyme